jgi:L,D-transpeptidase YbiS
MRVASSLTLLALFAGTLSAGEEVRLLSPPPAARPSLASRVPKRIVPPPPPLTDAQQLQAMRDEWVRSFAVEGLPPDAPTVATLITVDTAKNRLYLFRDGVLIGKAPVATGMDKLMKDQGREWLFRTPRGIHPVRNKVKDPVWSKPDWAFIEEKKPVPPADHPSRKVKGKLGRYALDLGDGILIHGTDDPASIGQKASHGCIRVGDKMLRLVWKESAVGTPVYIF